jgi:hypothetical protein
MPAPFDNGVMRFAWLSVMLTNWMGDEGVLKRLHVQIDQPLLYGDTTWYEATITGKINLGQGVLVQLKLTGANQLGQMNTIGEAELLLPITAAQAVTPQPNYEARLPVTNLD